MRSRRVRCTPRGDEESAAAVGHRGLSSPSLYDLLQRAHRRHGIAVLGREKAHYSAKRPRGSCDVCVIEHQVNTRSTILGQPSLRLARVQGLYLACDPLLAFAWFDPGLIGSSPGYSGIIRSFDPHESEECRGMSWCQV